MVYVNAFLVKTSGENIQN